MFRGGVYIHVPFCRVHCPYCDFVVLADRKPPRRQAFVEALLTSLEVDSPPLAAETIYIGGGTPSRLEDEALSAILQAVVARFCPQPPQEVTLEANPEDMTPARLQQWRRMGVTRLSVGVQRLDRDGLRRLGRGATHAHVQALPAMLAAWRDLGGRASVDLMYGLVDESPVAWARQLATADSARRRLPIDDRAGDAVWDGASTWPAI